MYESGGNPAASGDGGSSIGLFQMNMAGGLGTGSSVSALQDPAYNISLAAQAVYGGSGWSPWGEGTLYNGSVFGALGNHPYPGSSDGGTSPMTYPGGSGGGIPIDLNGDGVPDTTIGGSSSGGITYSTRVDYDGSLTGIPGAVVQVGSNGSVSIVSRPSTSAGPSPTIKSGNGVITAIDPSTGAVLWTIPDPTAAGGGSDPDGDGYDNDTGLPVGVVRVDKSVSPTGLVYKGIPVNPDGSPYSGGGSGGAASYDRTQVVKLPDGRTVLLDLSTGAIVTDYGKAPGDNGTQQWGSGTSGGGGGGGGGATGTASLMASIRANQAEEEANQRIRVANAEADAAIRVAQARAAAGDAGDAGALQRLSMELAQREAQFEKTYGLNLQQFQEQREQNRQRMKLEYTKAFQDAVSSTDPIAYSAWLAAQGGGNIANALQASPQGAYSENANLPAARYLQELEALNGTGTGAGGTATGGGLSSAPPQGSGQVVVGTNDRGEPIYGPAPAPTTPQAPQFTPTAGLGPPPEGYATWGDWVKERVGGIGDLLGQTVRDPSMVDLTRRGRFDPASLVVNPELEALKAGQQGGGYTGGTVVLDSQQALYDYLNRLGYASYQKQQGAAARSGPPMSFDSNTWWGAIAQDMAAMNAGSPMAQKGTDGTWGVMNPDGTWVPNNPPTAASGPAIAPDQPGGSIATAHNVGGVVITSNGLFVPPGTKTPDGAIAPPLPGTVTGGGLSTAERRFEGGPTRAPMIMTGDARARDPFRGGAKPEIVVNPTGAPLHVLRSSDTRAMMNQQGPRTMPQRGGGLARALAMRRQRMGNAQGGAPMMAPNPGMRMGQIPRFAEGTLYETSARRRGTTTPVAAPAPAPVTAQAPVTTAATTTSRRGSSITPAPAPAPAPAPMPVSTPTASPTTVATAAGPVATTGTVPTTTTVVPPTPVTGTATGGGLSSATTQSAPVAAPAPAPAPAAPAAAPAVTTTPATTTAATPTTTTVPAPVTTTATTTTPVATTATGGGLSSALAGAAGAIGSTAGGPLVTAADLPYLQQVGDLRAGVQLPEGVNLYDVGWENLDPVLRESYIRGLQSGYYIPTASSLFEQAKYALPGMSRAGMGLGY